MKFTLPFALVASLCFSSASASEAVTPAKTPKSHDADAPIRRNAALDILKKNQDKLKDKTADKDKLRETLAEKRKAVLSFWETQGSQRIAHRGVMSEEGERLTAIVIEMVNEAADEAKELLAQEESTVADIIKFIQEHQDDVAEIVQMVNASELSEEDKALINTAIGNLIPGEGVKVTEEKIMQLFPSVGANDTDADSLEDPYARRRLRRLDETKGPYPADGSKVTLGAAGAEIIFEEHAEGKNVTCFHFQQPSSKRKYRTCEKVAYDADANIATVTMKDLSPGDWTWWATDRKGGIETSKQTFTVEIPEKQRGVVGDEILRASDTAGEDPKTIVEEENTDVDIIVKNAGTTGAGETIVGEDEWSFGGQIQESSGRIYYTSFGVDYACSGTVIKDNKSGRTLILTAGHCVWDDIDGVWGSNAVFIPNRDAVDTTLTGDQVHRQCNEDICGCWTLSAGFVPEEWVYEPWPARLAFDWGIWVVDDDGSHSGADCGSDALDKAVDPMDFEIGVDLYEQPVTGAGYSLEYNPDFRYCSDVAEFRSPTAGIDTWWLPGCGLSGGASGGPWLMDTDTAAGTGKIVTVNSWSLSGRSGMGGPIIDAYHARCVVNAARDANFQEIESWDDGEEGIFVNCYYRDCVEAFQLGADTSEVYRRRLRGSNLKICDRDEHRAQKKN